MNAVLSINAHCDKSPIFVQKFDFDESRLIYQFGYLRQNSMKFVNFGSLKECYIWIFNQKNPDFGLKKLQKTLKNDDFYVI